MLSSLLKNLFPSRDADQLSRDRLNAWDAWLQPFKPLAITGESSAAQNGGSAGRDPGYEDAFFELKDEASKLSGIDDALIVRHCEQLTKETGKDLRVAAYYAQARLRQDGPAGFADGLELVAALVDRFGESILPARAEAKKGALDMLATTRMLGILDSRGEFAPEDLERAIAALDVLIARTSVWPETARPNLQPLVARFERNDDPARNDNAESAASQPDLAVAGVPTASTISSARDLLDQTRALTNWLRKQEDGYLSSARVARSIRWDTLHDLPPAAANGRTRLVAPRAEVRQQLKRLVLQKQWYELLERVEGALMEGANHLWFDLQYFQHVALDHIGSPYDRWRELLRADFALFLERLPAIERLAFEDGTPFADDTTREWIARHAVVRNLEAGDSVTPLPVSVDHEAGTAGDWPEIEAQARDIAAADGIEAAFVWLDALPGLRTGRQRYLQRLVMARIADHSGHADAALALLAELDASARAVPLARWEPALMFEVKHHLVRMLKAQSQRKDADKPALARRVGDLQAELTVLDPARALALR
ncbi:type VI secretion system protein TssA [Paraburkholderia edwinii]|uniref:Type VI secretion system protein TssA n=1 Tax=Paraburkholderia edwinii TaxID=2861782 RepID=A0ABX8UWR1_9BURK|nr:type VI secretion system protein TssA [Paraburkholderia edwinii]QYD71772.1 type VI secretion system protein TssA [Paraburkholderia edwinii]